MWIAWKTRRSSVKTCGASSTFLGKLPDGLPPMPSSICNSIGWPKGQRLRQPKCGTRVRVCCRRQRFRSGRRHNSLYGYRLSRAWTRDRLDLVRPGLLANGRQSGGETVVAAARGEFEISVGNILGSNIFNILMCIGSAVAVSPITLTKTVVRIDMIIMLGVTLFLATFMWTNKKIVRWEGTLLLLAYGGYLYYLFS